MSSKYGKIEVVFIGASAGGTDVLNHIFKRLPAMYPIPIVVTLHVPAHTRFVNGAYSGNAGLTMKEAEDKEQLEAGKVYFAPSDYHLLVEKDLSLSLTAEDPVHFARPSIDVMFQSVAESLGERAAGILLTGSNDDGASGLFEIYRQGGLTVVQDPKSAQYDMMPQAALKVFRPDYVADPDKIGEIMAGFGISSLLGKSKQ